MAETDRCCCCCHRSLCVQTGRKCCHCELKQLFPIFLLGFYKCYFWQYVQLTAVNYHQHHNEKTKVKRFKKSTSSEVISIMKFKPSFVNEINPQIHLLVLLLLETNQWVTRLLRLMWDICHDPRSVYSLCLQKFPHFHIQCQILTFLKNVCQNQIRPRCCTKPQCAAQQ